jgi:20S proteasome subunit beta 5
MEDPCDFVHNLKDAKGPERQLMNFKKGTTTLGFRFQGGVLLAVDSRAS